LLRGCRRQNTDEECGSMTFMIAAYSVIWLFTFAFVASIFVRQREIQRQLELVEQMLEAEAPQAADEDGGPQRAGS
jgi:CcmD family protein